MTIPYSPPTEPKLAWDQTSRLYRHYGTLPVGVTIYKDGDGWHEVTDYFDERILEGALVVYRGGREYQLTEAEFLEVILAGFGSFLLMYPGQCPGDNVFPTDGTYPGTGNVSEALLPGDDVFPGDDVYPGDGS